MQSRGRRRCWSDSKGGTRRVYVLHLSLIGLISEMLRCDSALGFHHTMLRCCLRDWLTLLGLHRQVAALLDGSRPEEPGSPPPDRMIQRASASYADDDDITQNWWYRPIRFQFDRILETVDFSLESCLGFTIRQ